ncbi:MAG: hypothetical protein PW734_06840 [Verrucomicrobium sp.]|nr:hypothetical protein [Verrucomicrobium sp.]
MNDAEIVALLEDGRMAETDIEAAISLALKHSQAFPEAFQSFEGVEGKKVTDWFGVGGHPPTQTKEFMRWGKSVRITIPRPPKRRALRREELPGWMSRYWSDWDLLTMRDRGLVEIVYEGKRVPLYQEEPQPPLVLTTEGKE